MNRTLSLFFPLTLMASLLLAVGLLVGGCTSSSHKNAATPDPAGNLILTNPHVITEPAGFRNVSFGCWGTKGVYVTSRGQWESSDGSSPASSDVQIVLNDPDCS
jgi:hypothetical protein